MTRTGIIRTAYRAIETPPSRFAGDGAYSDWATRADSWGESRFDRTGNPVTY